MVDQEANNCWQIIYQTCPQECAFMRKSWFDGWSMYFSGDRTRLGGLIYKYFSDQNGGIAILPYTIQKRGPFYFAALAGEFFPRRGIPYNSTSEELVNQTADYLCEIKKVCGVRLGPIVKSDTFIEEVLKVLKERGWRFIVSPMGHDFGMEVPEDYDEYYAGLSKNRKKKTAYYRRRLEDLGNVEIRHHKNLSVADWETVFEELEHVESKAWVSDEGDAHFIGPDHQYFWNGLVLDEWFRKAMNVWMLYVDERPVSYISGIDTGKERYMLASSYDADFAKFRTGHHLELGMIKDTIQEGKVTYINNGMGNSGYKSAWGSEEYQQLVDVIAFPPTLKGTVAYFIARAPKKLGK